MAEPIIMPKQGQSVESCIISQWHKKKGDKVSKGDILFSYETDKASFDEESPVDGILLEIFFEEGDDVPVLTNVCVIGQEGESVEEFRPKQDGEEAAAGQETAEAPAASEAAPAAETTPAAETAPTTKADPAMQPADIKDLKISPRARNTAERLGVDVRYAKPTGPYGRIIERDVIAARDAGHMMTPAAQAAAAGIPGGVVGTGLGGRVTTRDLETPAAAAGTVQPEVSAEDWLVLDPAYDEVKVPNIRKVIAKAMHQSLATTAQLTLNSSFDATEILEYRKKLKETQERMGLANITINDMILFAVSRTLPKYKDLNAHFLDDTVRYFHNVNLGMAVDTERGLMVPTIFHADKLSLNEIAVRSKKLAVECQTGSINPDFLRNGSFTVTNLGTLGIENFTPVLNPPQTGILGVGSIVQRAREVNGELEFYPAMGLSLTFDHRAIDGAPAARFLKELVMNLENFSVLLTR